MQSTTVELYYTSFDYVSSTEYGDTFIAAGTTFDNQAFVEYLSSSGISFWTRYLTSLNYISSIKYYQDKFYVTFEDVLLKIGIFTMSDPTTVLVFTDTESKSDYSITQKAA